MCMRTHILNHNFVLSLVLNESTVVKRQISSKNCYGFKNITDVVTDMNMSFDLICRRLYNEKCSQICPVP